MLAKLHPLAVHFPIALLLTALAAEWVWLWRKLPLWRDMAFWLLLLGTAGSFIAAITGGWAEDAAQVSNEVHEIIERHETVGYIMAWVYAVLLVWKLLRRQYMQHTENAAFAGALSLAAGLLIFTAYLGGTLVYDHAVGVHLPAQP
jgi:uncharacterized membrane protein